MTTIEGYEFEDEEVVMDFTRYVDCTFTECTLVYHGLGEAHNQDSDLIDCEVELRGPAQHGIEYLRTVVEDGGKGPVIGIIQQAFPDSTLMAIEGDDDQFRYLLDVGPIPDHERGQIEEEAVEAPAPDPDAEEDE